LTQGEGLLLADLDMALILKRKRMMDSVGHYARPELLSLLLDKRPTSAMHLAEPPPLPHTQPALGGPDDAGHDDLAADRGIDQRPAIARLAAG
jgi:aliphatic nitrilase